MKWPFAYLWDSAQHYLQFAAEAVEQQSLWTKGYRLARVAPWALAAVRDLPERVRLVVLAEDWCTDGAASVPVLARWAFESGLELRVLRRDEHPEVMDRYLSGSSRSIPVVILLTEDMEELGWWGPRPAALDSWVQEQVANGRDRKSLLPEIRRWYAKDRGESVLREILAMLPVAVNGR